jgi:cell division septation protein DedD
MRTTLRSRRRQALLTLVGTLAVVALAVVSPSGALGRYSEPAGDAHGAPDITGVTVTSDTAGQIVFAISTADLPPEQGIATLVGLDTDSNESTGAPETLGADYMLFVDEGENAFGFLRWTGSDWDDAPSATVRVRSSRTGVLASVNRSELGGTQSLNFWVRTIRGEVASGQMDDAPDDGTWNYTLTAGGPDIREIVVTTSPAPRPKAGKRFTVTPTAVRVPGLDPLAAAPPRPESYTCKAKLGSKALAGSGTGSCTFTLKKAARGKKLTVAVTVTYQGASKTATFVYRVA